ncbi:polymorphic toxin-type HINT domain-containing protein [Kutzneria buriramensis]|uniref:Intein/RHS repeat-associated protein n=1 Tax=Kutzneria buriramensis TaxID=1045776 RepID=A0A3E0HBK9_9PSEU|nr:polymorphic toxin-type HINT domain-containing protein [Kutzneria buriramensis]REH41828.1 intein/RHS repeat-associated protein [Kutzneria buriramensis]
MVNLLVVVLVVAVFGPTAAQVTPPLFGDLPALADALSLAPKQRPGSADDPATRQPGEHDHIVATGAGNQQAARGLRADYPSIKFPAAAPKPNTASATNGQSAVRGFDPATSKEVPTESGRNQTTYRNTDGTETTAFSKDPVNYRKPDGSWQAIDTTLVSDNDGWRNASDEVSSRFAGHAGGSGMVSFGLDGDHVFAYGLDGAQPVSGQTQGSAVTYPRVLADTDLRLDVKPGGVKESLVLASRNAPHSFLFPLQLRGLTAKLVDGRVALVDAAGKERASIPAGSMSDASRNPHTGDPASSTGVSYHLAPGGLRVDLDQNWLNDPARQYPVVVDPSVDSPNASAAMYTQNGVQNDGGTELKTGFDGDDNLHTATYLKFDGIESRLRNEKIFGAQLYLVNDWSWSCQPKPVSVHAVNSEWSGNPSVGPELAESSFAHGYIASGQSRSDCPVAGEGIDLGPAGRDVVQAWVNGTMTNHGLAVRASDTDSYGWKKFTGASTANPPKLFVTHTPYNADYNITQPVPTPPVTRTTSGQIKITVTNRGLETWTPTTYKLGYRVYTSAGRPVASKEAATLPGNVARGQSVSLDATIQALDPGDYYLDFSMLKVGGPFFTDEQIPPARLVMRVYNIPPVVRAQYPPNGYSAPTLTPQLWADAVKIDAPPNTSLQYRFEVCAQDSAGNPTGCFDSGHIPSDTWTVPAGKLSWSKAYVWRAFAFDGTDESQTLPYSALLTAVPQPEITSHLGNAPYSTDSNDFDPQVGNFYRSALDAALAFTGPQISVARTYNSLDPRRANAFGAGWATQYDMSVVPDNDNSGNVVVTYPDGQQVRFGLNPDGTYAPPDGRYASLTHPSDTVWDLVDKSATKYEFVADKLSSIADSQGRTIVLTYTGGKLAAVRRPSPQPGQTGLGLAFTWAGAHVTAVTVEQASGTAPTWSYSYDGDKLTKVCDPLSDCTTYNYEAGSHYRSAVLDGKPDSYWRLGDSSGPDARSEVGVNLGADKGTYKNVTLGAAGPVAGSSAATFDGTSSAVTLPAGTLRKDRNLAVSLWFRTAKSGPLVAYQNQPLGGDKAPTAAVPMLYVGTDGKLRGQLWTGHVAPITTGGTVNDGKWHQVVLTGAMTTQQMYLDGTLVGSLDGAINALDMDKNQLGADFIVNPGDWPGTSGGQWQYYAGDLAEVAFYEHPLGQPAVAAQFAAAGGSDELDKITLPSGKIGAAATYDVTNDRVRQYTDANGGVWTLAVPTTTGSADNPIKVASVRDPAGRPHEYDYDPLRGRIVRSIAPLGQGVRPEDTPGATTTTTPTPTDTCTTPTDGGPIFCGGPVGGDPTWVGGPVAGEGVRTYSYDSSGFQNTITDENGDQVTLAYDKRGNVVSKKTCRTAQTDCQTAYVDYFLNADSATDPRNDKPVATRDARSANATDSTYLTSVSYTATGLLDTQTTADGGKVKHTYTTGREAIDPATGMSGSAPGFCPCVPAGLVMTSTDAMGAVTTYNYFLDGTLAQATSASGLVTKYTYDSQGRVLTQTQVSDSQPAGATTQFTYDVLSRIRTVTQPATTDAVTGVKHTARSTTTYDADGNVAKTEVTDLTGGDKPRSVSYEYDAHNLVSKQTDALGNATSYGHDAFGNRVWTVDPAGTKTKFLYTARNQLAEVVLVGWTGAALSGVTGSGGDGNGDTSPKDDLPLRSYAYDLGGRLVRDTDAMGRTTKYTYYNDDLVHQVIQVGFHSNDTTRDIVLHDYSYDAAGKVVKDVAGGGKATTATTYDAVGRIATTTVDPTVLMRKTSYTYNLNGAVTSVVRTGNRSNAGPFSPDTAEVVDYGYDSAGRQTSQVVHNSSANLTTSYAYDQRGLMTATTDPRGNVANADRTAFTTSYRYDERGRQIGQTLPPVAVESNGGQPSTQRPATTVGLDTFGDQVAAKDPVGNISRAEYDQDGRQVSQIAPSYTAPGTTTAITPTTTLAYDSLGHVVTETDPRGNATKHAYDQLGRLVRTEEPGSRASVFQYDYDGELLQSTVPGGATTTATYDDLGRMVTSAELERVPQPAAYTTSYGYDDIGHPISVTTPAGEKSTATFDGAGEQTSTTDAAGVTTQYGYDLAGRTVLVSDALSRNHWTNYDQAGRAVSTSDWKGGSTHLRDTSAAYDPAGNLLSVTDALNHTTAFAYNAANQVVQQTEPVSDTKSVTTSYGYDAAGRQSRLTDGRGNATVTTYNSLGLKESVTEPATATQPAATWTASYDAAGNVVGVTAPGGVATASTFDELNRMVKQTGSGAEAATADRVLGYDDAGRLTSVSAPGGTETVGYDDRGDVLSTTGSGADSTFSYDADGRTATRSDAAGKAVYHYVNGRIASVQDGITGVVQTAHYDAAGAVDSVAYSSGQSRGYSYDDLGRITSDTTKTAGGSVLASVSYGYDAADNLTEKDTAGTAGAGTNSYGYDYAGRMVSWTAGGKTTSYGWDDAGNRVQAGSKTASYDQRNRLLSDGDYTYTYTPRGTLASRTSSGLTEKMSFDAFDRMVGDGSSSYTYDGLDRLAVRNGQTFSYSGLGDQIAGDGTSTYSRAPSGELLATGNGNDKQLTISDKHDDVVAGFAPGDGNTGLSHSAAYDPFGQVTATSGTQQSIGFQGAYTDPDTAQVHMGARWYNPSAGGFDSRDSIQIASDPNRYSYGLGAPTNYTDPSGHCPWCLIAVAVIGISWLSTAIFAPAPPPDPTVRRGKKNITFIRPCSGNCGGGGGNNPPTPGGSPGSWGGGTGAGSCSGYACDFGPAPAPPDPAIAARQAQQQAAQNNPIPVPKALQEPHYTQQAPPVSATPSLPANQVAQSTNVIADNATQAQQLQQAVTGNQPVIQTVKDAGPSDVAPTDCSTCIGGRAPLGDRLEAAGHGILDTSSLIPGLGSIAGGLNALWYGLEGDWANAVPAGVSAIPFASDVKFLSSLAGDADRIAPRLGDDAGPGGACLTGANSFAGDTSVEMADGSTKPIDSVEVGDRVRATDPTTGKTADEPVTDVIVGQGLKHLVDVDVTDDGKSGSVTATDNHPFWVVDLGRWANAGQLKAGEHLLTDDGRTVVVNGLRTHDETTRVYNLTVDTLHTFYVLVGADPVLVHNSTCIKLYQDLSAAEAANSAVDSLRSTGRLPAEYITKDEAEKLGWQPGKALNNYAPGRQIGGDTYRNDDHLLPEAPGRTWYEADVGISPMMKRSKQPGWRLLYSDDGLAYVTSDHYETFYQLPNWK